MFQKNEIGEAGFPVCKLRNAQGTYRNHDHYRDYRVMSFNYYFESTESVLLDLSRYLVHDLC